MREILDFIRFGILAALSVLSFSALFTLDLDWESDPAGQAYVSCLNFAVLLVLVVLGVGFGVAAFYTRPGRSARQPKSETKGHGDSQG